MYEGDSGRSSVGCDSWVAEMEVQYTSRFRSRVNRQLAKQLFRRNLSGWVRYWATNTFYLGILLSTVVYHARKVPADRPVTSLVYLPLGFAGAVVLIYLYVHHHQSLDSMDRQNREGADAGHDAFLTPERWGVTDSNGVTVTIPWRIMEITFETEDAWVVHFGSDEMTIDRIGLREAGLEDEFRARVGK